MMISISPGITLIPMDQAELLSQRYGEKQSNPKRTRLLTVIGIALLTAIAAWFGFANYSPLSYQDIGFRVINNTTVEVDFEVTAPAGTVAICAIQALNNSFAQVGWVELILPASESSTNRHTVTLTTTELAVTGLVDECRLR